MKWRSLLLAAACLLFLASCTRFISPYEAANGRAKCGRGVR
ncbi:hypothetical protein [Niastella koreensis]|nr:hypothetical protein [Niastella koreensis]